MNAKTEVETAGGELARAPVTARQASPGNSGSSERGGSDPSERGGSDPSERGGSGPSERGDSGPSARSAAGAAAASDGEERVSVDPMRATDRYRLVVPFSLRV